MAHLGKDMDIFGGLFDKEDGDNDPKNKENTAADKAEDNKGNENSATDKAEDVKSGGENSKADSVNDKSTGTEISSKNLGVSGDSDSDGDKDKGSSASDSDKDGDEGKDPDKDGDNDSSKAGDSDNDMDSDKDGDNDGGLKEGESDQILEDLVKDLEASIDDVDSGRDNAKDVLDKTLKELQGANMKIKELEEEGKVYQDKYFEKFGENSEMNLMKPMIDTIQKDPELFLLVKSYKGGDSDSKVNSLVGMLEKATGIDVSKYLTDSNKDAISSSTSTGSDGNTTRSGVKPEFTPDKTSTGEDLLF